MKEEFKTFLRRILTSESYDWPEANAVGFSEFFMSECLEQELAPLCCFLVSKSEAWRKWPSEVREKVEALARMQMAIETFNESEMRLVLGALQKAQIVPLLFKGSSLAYSIYPQPWLRPRVDTDFLIRDEDRAVADQVFKKLSYDIELKVSGELISYQKQFYKFAKHGLQHDFDCHWKISTPQPFADIFSYADLKLTSQELTDLGNGISGISDVDAVLVGCVHRFAHHFDEERVLWYYDIHLLVSQRDTEWWNVLVEKAIAKGIAGICGETLLQARSWCGTSWPEEIVERLLLPKTKTERTSKYLNPSLSFFKRVIMDIQGLSGFRKTLRYLREGAFPSSKYILAKYGAKSKAALPWLYARRLFSGALRHLTARKLNHFKRSTSFHGSNASIQERTADQPRDERPHP